MFDLWDDRVIGWGNVLGGELGEVQLITVVSGILSGILPALPVVITEIFPTGYSGGKTQGLRLLGGGSGCRCRTETVHDGFTSTGSELHQAVKNAGGGE